VSIAIFLCGPAGCGKSTLAKDLVPVLNTLAHGPFCLLDKDTMTDPLSEALLHSLTGCGLDRDGPAYKAHARDREYESVLDTAKENMELGLNVVLPGPWSKEIASGAVFDPKRLGFSQRDKTLVVWLHVAENDRLGRILARGNPRDAYKLDNWSSYAKSLPSWGSTPPKGLLVLNAMREVSSLRADVLQALEQLK
jgi:energy-coupling factor transporter ATP-binding protein EcfA2